MSGFFSQIAGSLLGSSAPVTAALPGILGQLLGTAEGSTGGALPVLLAQFEQAGLGEHVQSWLGNNQNLVLTAEQVVAAIPPEQLDAMAEKVGIPRAEMAAVLAHVLPHAVDAATPNGQLPASGATPAASPDFASLIGNIFKG